MQNFTRRGALASALALSAAGAARADTAALNAALQQSIDAGDVTGAVLLVRSGGKDDMVVLGHADKDKAVPLAADSIVWVASMTKPVVAATVLKMVDAGKIGLDDPIGKYIPAFAAKPRMVRTPKAGFSWPKPPIDPAAPPVQYDLRPAKRDITIRDVLTQTSGLQTIGIPNPAIPEIGPTETVAQWTPKLADAPLDFEPGSRFAYSNATAFELAVRAVEVASGEGYADFFRKNFAEPLEMTSTSFGPRADLKARTLPSITVNQITNGVFTSGSAGLFTTAQDYSNFQQMLLGQGAYKGRRILSAASVAKMGSNQAGDVGFPGLANGGYGGLQERVTPGFKLGLGGLVVTDAAAAGMLPVPNGSFGWDGIGQRRMWVIPARGMTITMLILQAKPGGAERLQRAVERAALG